MDNSFISDEAIINANLTERTDLSYDNDALDVLTELFDNENFPDDLLNPQTRDSPQNTRPDVGQPAPAANVNLPDSPPYSGSEPYSPDSNNLLLSPSCGSDISTPSSGYRTGPSPDPAQHQYPISQAPMPQQQVNNSLLAQQQQLQKLQEMQTLQEMHRLQQLQQQNAARANAAAASQMMVHPGVHLAMQPTANMNPMIHDEQIQAQPYSGNASSPYPANKKRKYPTESSPPLQHVPQSQLQVKQEPVIQQQQQQQPQPQPPVNYDVETSSMDISPGMLNGGSYQPIKWREFEKQAWCPSISVQGQPVTVLTYRLDGDKGFNYSQVDKAFVCQKKNHFQITGCVSFADTPSYVMTPEGPKPIEGIYMHFYGVKEEAPNQVIQVDQSQADRSKKKFAPVPLQHNQENSWKVTIGRLHFSDTTLNNMRKRGKPNPDQRYFLLVVGIFAHSQGKEYPLVQQCSEKLIVRASNPGQFQDSEAEPVKWQPGQTPNSIHHSGKVGINTETPDEALVVAGNVKVMGNIMQPSDQRVKEDITEVDTKAQLKNVQALNLYNYKYTEQFANAVGLDDPNAVETGVLAQELEVVIPEAVKSTTDVQLPNGEVVEQLKVVDKNRLFMESLGAVKELSNITDTLETKINYLERFNKRLQKIKRFGSIKSTASTDTNISHHTSISSVSRVTVHRKSQHSQDSKLNSLKPDSTPVKGSGGVCSNKFLQILIFLLVLVMVACIGVIIAMLFLDKAEETSNSNISAGKSTSTTTSSEDSTVLTGESAPSPAAVVDPATSLVPDGVGGGGLRHHPVQLPVVAPGMSNFPQSDFPESGASAGEGFIPLTAIDECRKKMLVGPGCDIFQDTCRVDTCPNQCLGFLDANTQLGLNKESGLKPTPQPEFTVLLGSSSPQAGEPFEYKPYASKKSSGSVRRRRSVPDDHANPLSDVKFSMIYPVKYDLKPDNCLNCQYSAAKNFTYAIQVHRTFPGANSTLQIESAGKWKNVIVCPTYEQPRDNKCQDPGQDLRDVVGQSIKPQAYSLNKLATFHTQVGRYIRTGIVLRFTDDPVSNAEVMCKQQQLSPNMLEVRVWFMRRCSDCGDFDRRLIKDLSL